MLLESSYIAHTHTTCAFKYLYNGVIALHFNYLCHQVASLHCHVANLILCYWSVCKDGHEVGDHSYHLASCFHLYLVFIYLSTFVCMLCIYSLGFCCLLELLFEVLHLLPKLTIERRDDRFEALLALNFIKSLPTLKYL